MKPKNRPFETIPAFRAIGLKHRPSISVSNKDPVGGTAEVKQGMTSMFEVASVLGLLSAGIFLVHAVDLYRAH